MRQDEFGEPLESTCATWPRPCSLLLVGLAGVQIGDLRRIIVADLKEEGDEEHQAETA